MEERSDEKHNYKCALTGAKGKICVHHYHNFWKIVQDVHDTHSIKVETTVEEYDKGELELLEKYVTQKHTLDCVITEDIHRQFHSLYGNKDNTREQFEEFAKKNHET